MVQHRKGLLEMGSPVPDLVQLKTQLYNPPTIKHQPVSHPFANHAHQVIYGFLLETLGGKQTNSLWWIIISTRQTHMTHLETHDFPIPHSSHSRYLAGFYWRSKEVILQMTYFPLKSGCDSPIIGEFLHFGGEHDQLSLVRFHFMMFKPPLFAASSTFVSPFLP